MRAPSVLPCARAWRICLSAAPTTIHQLQGSSRTFFSLAFSAASSLVALRAWRCSDLAVNCEVGCQPLRCVRHGKLARIVLLLHCRHLGSSTQDKLAAAGTLRAATLSTHPPAWTITTHLELEERLCDAANRRSSAQRCQHAPWPLHTHSRGRSCWAGGRQEEQQRGWCAGQRECAGCVCCVLADVRVGLRGRKMAWWRDARRPDLALGAGRRHRAVAAVAAPCARCTARTRGAGISPVSLLAAGPCLRSHAPAAQRATLC
jgi:hypothetical protein